MNQFLFKYPIFILALLVFSFCHLNAQDNNKKLIIEANEHDLKTIGIDKNKIIYKNLIELNYLFNDIKTKAYSLAYLNIDLDTIIKSDSIFLKIKLNEKYKWTSLKVNNHHNYPFLKKELRVLKNIDASPENTQSTIYQILDVFENNGFPFASINLKNIEVNNEKIEAVIDINTGPKFIIDSVVVKSNFPISAYFIESVIGIRSNDIYKKNNILKISKNLEQYSFFSLMQTPEISFSDSTARVTIYLKKEKANNFDALIGFASEDDNSLSFTGYLKMKLVNVFGKASMFKINWNKLIKDRQLMESSIYYPYILNTAFGVDYNFKLYKHDTAYLNLNQKAALKLLISPNQTLEVYGDFFSSQLISKHLPQEQLDLKNTTYGFLLMMQNLDFALNPRKGYFINIDLGIGLKRIIKNPNLDISIYDSLELQSSFYRSEFSGGLYIPLFRQSTFLIMNKSAKKWDKNIFANELYRSGGFEFMRGFEEDEILSSGYTIFNGEYRFLLTSKSFLQLFYDYGIFEKNSKIDKLMSFGAGMRFNTNTGIFSLAFAIGKREQQTFQFSNTKVHLGYSVLF